MSSTSVCVSLCARMCAVIVYECVKHAKSLSPLLFQCGVSWGKERPLDPRSEPQLAEGDKTNRLPHQDAAEWEQRRRRWVERRWGRWTAEKCHIFIRPTKRLHLCVYVSAHMSVCMCASRRNLKFHIGPLTGAITQPYSHLSLTFSKCYIQNAKLQQGQRDTGKKNILARKNPPICKSNNSSMTHT